jgi:hypothetical protein
MKVIFSWGKFHYVRDDFQAADINNTGCLLSTAIDKHTTHADWPGLVS